MHVVDSGDRVGASRDFEGLDLPVNFTMNIPPPCRWDMGKCDSAFRVDVQPQCKEANGGQRMLLARMNGWVQQAFRTADRICEYVKVEK